MVVVSKVLALAVLGVSGLMGGSGDPLKIKPIQTLAGGDSKLDFPMVRMIQTQKSWKDLWAMHKGLPFATSPDEKAPAEAPKLPTVDFEKNQVLVVFGGHLENVQAYEYIKTYAKDEIAVIQLGQSRVPPTAEKAMMHPFILMVIPREPVAIEVELDSIAKDGTHFWLKIAGYRAPKEIKANG